MYAWFQHTCLCILIIDWPFTSTLKFILFVLIIRSPLFQSYAMLYARPKKPWMEILNNDINDMGVSIRLVCGYVLLQNCTPRSNIAISKTHQDMWRILFHYIFCSQTHTPNDNQLMTYALNSAISIQSRSFLFHNTVVIQKNDCTIKR